MRRRTSIIPLLLLTFTLISIEAAAQEENLNIEAPPEGELSNEQLANIAADIHRFIANPTAPDADAAYGLLILWAMNTREFSLSVCPGVIDMKEMKTNKSIVRLLGYHILSCFAFMIEHPDEADDQLAVNLAGVHGMVRAYSAVKAKMEGSFGADFADVLVHKDSTGTLKEHVAEAIEGCGDEE